MLPTLMLFDMLSRKTICSSVPPIWRVGKHTRELQENKHIVHSCTHRLANDSLEGQKPLNRLCRLRVQGVSELVCGEEWPRHLWAIRHWKVVTHRLDAIFAQGFRRGALHSNAARPSGARRVPQ